ncbi:MAG: ATP-binding protein [Bacteroidota bacterium]
MGANASGKSNALEGIRLLSWLAQGQNLHQMSQEVNQSQQIVRGFMGDLPRRGSQQFGLGCELAKHAFPLLTLQIEYQLPDELHVRSESIKDKAGNWLLQTVGPISNRTERPIPLERLMSVANPSDPQANIQLEFSDQVVAFSRISTLLPSFPISEQAKESIKASTQVFATKLSSILFLDPNPSLMRGYGRKGENRLAGDGRNLSAVLYDLWVESEEAESNQKNILQLVASLPEQDIRSIDFLHTPRGEVLVRLEETFGGETILYDAGLLSDGTLRVLAIASALLSSPKGSMVVIEEIGSGVHPSRVRGLLNQVYEIAEARDLQILISTHNAVLLDALPKQALGEVVCCYRNPQHGYSELIQLQDLPSYPELLAQGELGSLVSRGLVEKFIKQPEDGKEKKRKALAWLDSLR